MSRAMTNLLLTLVILVAVCSSAMAGKNAGGALVVHTDDSYHWRGQVCSRFDDVVPQHCLDLNTQSNESHLDTALIWFIAAFPWSAHPGVTVAYFGNDHNLPEFYHNRWGYCDNGTTGTIEVPDTGWPEFPETAGISIAYGQPVTGNTFFPVYYFSVWGFENAYYGSAINPTGGYAAYVDDSNPPVTDPIELFGRVRWYEPGNNDCPSDDPLPGACCLPGGECILTEGPDACLAAGGYEYMGDGWSCDPDPCPGACCFYNGDCILIRGPDECSAAGGYMYMGDGTVCDPNPCPLGACCFYNGDCILALGPEGCSSMGGTQYLGDGTVCDPNPCPQPGACCFADGSCTYTLEASCYDSGGTLWVPDTTCNPNPCPQPGACCHGCEECAVLTQAECEDLPDDYIWIPNEDCTPNPCPPTATDTSTWGEIKAKYK